MTFEKFSNGVKDLCEFYERKSEPKISTLELWHAKVSHIPDEAMPWIVRRITEEYESFPRNLPMAMRSATDEWFTAHPEKAAHERYFDCPDCNHGLIYVERRNVKPVYSYVFRCERCRQNRVIEYPMALLSSLLSAGFTIPKHIADAERISKRLSSWQPKTMLLSSEEHEEKVRDQARQIRRAL